MNHQIIRKETLYFGRAFNVQAVEMELPNGRQVTYDLVDHLGSITIVPVDALGNLYFVRQYRLAANGMLLELPAGVLEENEDPLVGAGREIREETGLAAGTLHKLGEVYLAPGYSNEHMVIYLATDLYPAPLDADDDEFLELEIIPCKEAFQKALTGQIADSKTLAALLLAQPYLAKHFQL